MGQRYREKGAHRAKNRSLHACSVGQAQIKENILQSSLHQSQHQDACNIAPVWQAGPLSFQAGEQNRDQARHAEADPGKQQLAGVVLRSNLKELISGFHTGKRAAP